MGKTEAEIRKLYEETKQKPRFSNWDFEEKMLPVTDGIRLRTMIWSPKSIEEKKFPVIFVRSCYQQQEATFRVHAEELCRRGFAFVLQWCRGTAGSEGEWVPNIHERKDGLDTLEWLCEQQFAGNIGYWGDSYLASTGWCMADAVPEQVKSMYLGVYGTDRYTSVYQDGLFRQDIFTAWAMENAGVKIEADYLTSCRFQPQIKVDEELWNTRLNWYRDWISNTDRDSKYWSQEGFWNMMKEIPAKVKIPVYIREGWYDHHLGSALNTYKSLANKSRNHSVLQIGPWRHEYDVVLEGQKIDNLVDDSVQSVLDWFEQTLVQELLPEPKIMTYVIGKDEWNIRNPLVHRRTETLKMYLHSGENELKEGKLSVAKESEVTQIEFVYDPDDPVMSWGAESCFHSKKQIGSLFQPEPGYRDDVISFVSERMEEAVIIDGVIEVKLFVSSDAPDTAFTAKLMEVMPDGKTVNIRGNITTLAYRNHAEQRKRYYPETIVEVQIKMWPVAWGVRKGSRLRLDISSSDFPQYAIHSNYEGVWAMQEKNRKAKQSIYIGAGKASFIEIPILKEEKANIRFAAEGE